MVGMFTIPKWVVYGWGPPVMFVGEHNPIQLYSYLRIINYGYDIVMFTNLANELGPQNG